jgi:hypothetical protein
MFAKIKKKSDINCFRNVYSHYSSPASKVSTTPNSGVLRSGAGFNPAKKNAR